MGSLTGATDSPFSAGSPMCKSWVASRFELVEEAGISKRRCKYANCDKEYSRGTSHMILKRHWRRQHQKRSDDSPASPRNSNYNYDDSRKVTKKKPLNASNQATNGTPSKGRTACYVNNAHQTINKSSKIDKSQIDVKLIAKRLKESSSIHLTFEIHTPRRGGKSYGIITAHSLVDNREIRSVLLEYKHLPYPDDSAALHEFLRSCLTRYSIKDKVVSIASGCAETTEGAVLELDKRFRMSRNFGFTTVHIKCFPQLIHLNVSLVLRSQESLLEDVRKVAAFINSNHITLRPLQGGETAGTIVANKFAPLDDGTQELAGKTTGLKLPIDNKGSWNTIYNMIETFIRQRSLIEPALLYFQNLRDLTEVNIDWDRLFVLVQMLKPFFEVMNKFATDNYTPVSLVAVAVPSLVEHLSNSAWAYDDIVIAAHNFKIQLESYMRDYQSDLTVTAGLLDPRVKDSFISPDDRNRAIDMLRGKVENNGQAKNDDGQRHHLYQSTSIWSSIFRSSSFDEVTDYLSSPREHGCISSIIYWEAHKQVYPLLYNLAKTLICVQATSVPGDRVFSAAENAEREKKTQIDGTNSKELMKSWAKYLEG